MVSCTSLASPFLNENRSSPTWMVCKSNKAVLKKASELLPEPFKNPAASVLFICLLLISNFRSTQYSLPNYA